MCVITCNRNHFFEKCITSMPKVDEVLVVNDGQRFPSKYIEKFPNVTKVIENNSGTPFGVAVSKNKAFRYLMEKECDHIFLSEDDIIIKNPNICTKYIKVAEASGIWHLNYALHGSYNKDQEGNPVIKNVIEYGPGVEVAFYHNILGAFSYYLASIIKHIGYMDERMKNANEHIDHTYRIIKKNLHPPFWFFADVAESWNDIQDQTDNFEGSVIRKDEKEWQTNYQNSMALYQHKHGFIPQNTPQVSETEVLTILEKIKNEYAKNIGI